MASITWLDEPEVHDYAAAESYLSLLLGPQTAAAAAAALRRAATVQHPAKDLLRAAHLGVLPADDAEVARDLKKVKRGHRLSPVLLVRGRLDDGVALTVADGFHRVCAAYRVDEDAAVPARIVDLPGTPAARGGRPPASR